jgi:pilus assembly protein FimV
LSAAFFLHGHSVTQVATEDMLRPPHFSDKTPARPSAWLVASLLACTGLSVEALALGQFSVASGLGEPLRAALEITQHPTEDLPEPKPWASGHLAMNDTLRASPVGAAKPSTGKPQGETAWAIAPVVFSPALAVSTAPSLDSAARKPEDTITVRSGDTASQLVVRKMPAGVSLDQMLLAMLRANPEAFIAGNVNLLREGAQVHLPSAQSAAQISTEEARQTVIAQTADFVAYAQRLAQSTWKATDTASREMTGKVATQAPPAVPVHTEQDKLTLSKGEVNADSADARLALEREIQDKTEQLAALKKNLATLNALSVKPDPEKTSPHERLALKPSLTAAAAEAHSAPWLNVISRHPSIWVWVMALLVGMVGWVWVVRRRPAEPVELVGTDSLVAPAPDQAPPASPFPSGLPPQFAELDLNLTPAPDTASDPQARHTPGQSQ